MKFLPALPLGILLSLTSFSISQAAAITFTSGTFDNSSVLSLAGNGANEVYGVDFGGGAFNANGYSFSDYSSGTNFSLSTAPSTYNGYLNGADQTSPSTTGNSGLDTALTNGAYGFPSGTLDNLTVGTTYEVLSLFVDTRQSVADLGRQISIDDGISDSAGQAYTFVNGSPHIGGYQLGTFTADATTQTFSPDVVDNFAGMTANGGTQYQVILLVTPAIPEPSTDILLLGGVGVFCAFGYFRSRRRRQS